MQDAFAFSYLASMGLGSKPSYIMLDRHENMYEWNYESSRKVALCCFT